MWSFFRNKEKSKEFIVEQAVGKVVRVEDLDFIGVATESPNGRHLFAWSDADREKG